jgi:hypothetical protein
MKIELTREQAKAYSEGRLSIYVRPADDKLKAREKAYKAWLKSKRDKHYRATAEERGKTEKYREWLRRHGINLNEYHKAEGF